MRCTPSALVAEYLAGRDAHYLLIVKRNQPGLHAQLAALPGAGCRWPATPVNAATAAPERRTLKITSIARQLAFLTPFRLSR
jgi:hypothetical protein